MFLKMISLDGKKFTEHEGLYERNTYEEYDYFNLFNILSKEIFYFTFKSFNIEEFDKEGLDFTNPDYT